MSLTAPGCPVAGEMPGWVSDAVKPVEGLNSVHVEMVWEPQWGMEMMSDEARLELELHVIKHMSSFLSISKSAASHIKKIMESGAGKALRIGLKKEVVQVWSTPWSM